MKANRNAIVVLCLLIAGSAVIASLHLRTPHHITPTNPALYRLVHDENFYNVSVAISESAPRQTWCGVLSKAASDLNTASRDYMWKDSIYIDAYLQSPSGLSAAPVASFQRYIPIKNGKTPMWERWLEFPKDDKCTIVGD